MSGRDLRGLGCAALIGASIAFPLGLLVGGGGEPARDNGGQASRPKPADGRAPIARDVYSPRVVSDPYVIEQQRRVLRALETSCRQSRQHCEEAEQARGLIEDAEAGR